MSPEIGMNLTKSFCQIKNMKRQVLSVLFLIPCTFALLIGTLTAQAGKDIYIVNIENKVKERVASQMEQWLEKDEFETSEEYLGRLNQKEDQVKIFTEEAIDFYMQKHIDRIDFSDYYVDRYDADSESFLLTITQIGSFILAVPRDDARSFKENREYLTFSNPGFVIRDNSWVLSYLDVECLGNNYTYDISQDVTYNAADNFSVASNDLDIEIPQAGSVRNYSIKKRQLEDLDEGLDLNTELPFTKANNPEAIAVVIGNRDYEATKPVNYALNDAQAMRKYLVEVLGFKKGNVILMENATKGDFEYLFGNQTNHKGRLFNMVKDGISDIFVFYSGHGAPGLNTKKGYFVPIECEPNSVDLSGYSLDLFYENISKIPAKSKTVVIDACFSGVNIFENISPIVIRPKASLIDDKNTIVFTSTGGSQVSSWYHAKRHSLFTFFFLKALHQMDKVDANQNREVTYKEIYDYITDKNYGIPYYARRLNDLEQMPTIQGADPETVLLKY